MNYNWKIISKDDNSETMVVEFTILLNDGTTQADLFNLSYPPKGIDIKAYIENTAVNLLKARTTIPAVSVVEGFSGSGIVPEERVSSTTWAPLTNTLEDVKALKLSEIKNWRGTQENKGIVVDNMRISTDKFSQYAMCNILYSMDKGIISEVWWKNLDNEFVQLNNTKLLEIYTAATLFIQSIFTSEREYYAKINACTTIEQLNSLVMP